MLKNSLKDSASFKKVYNEGTSYANKYLVMYILDNGTNANRVGISVSKKVGNSVIRHRITRYLRESYRAEENYLKTGYDIVVVARISAGDKKYRDLFDSFIHLCKLHDLIKEMVIS